MSTSPMPAFLGIVPPTTYMGKTTTLGTSPGAIYTWNGALLIEVHHPGTVSFAEYMNILFQNHLPAIRAHGYVMIPTIWENWICIYPAPGLPNVFMEFTRFQFANPSTLPAPLGASQTQPADLFGFDITNPDLVHIWAQHAHLFCMLTAYCGAPFRECNIHLLFADGVSSALVVHNTTTQKRFSSLKMGCLDIYSSAFNLMVSHTNYQYAAYHAMSPSSFASPTAPISHALLPTTTRDGAGQTADRDKEKNTSETPTPRSLTITTATTTKSTKTSKRLSDQSHWENRKVPIAFVSESIDPSASD